MNAGTTIAAASVGQVLPQRTLHLASAPGFPSRGSIIIDTAGGPTVVHYTGIARGGTRITGCSGGSGSLALGDTVRLVSNVATIATASDGQSLPQKAIYVSSNQGMPVSGTVVVASSVGPQLVTYTGLIGTDGIAGCSGGRGTVSAGGTVTVPYCATIGSGIKTLRDLRNAPYGDGFDPGPRWRSRVLVDPGTYNEMFTIPPFVDLMGTSGDPADVQVTFAVTTLAVVTVVGTSYVGNITSVCTGTGKAGGVNQSAWDLTNVSGPATVVLDNCVGVSTNPYQRALSSYTNSDQFLGYFNCSFSQGQPDDIDHGKPYSYPVEVEFNLHEGGSSVPRTAPSVQLFYNCRVTKTGTFHAPADPAPLHVADIGSGEKDVFIWVNGPDGRIDRGVDRHQINIAGVAFRGGVGATTLATSSIPPSLTSPLRPTCPMRRGASPERSRAHFRSRATG